MTDQPVSDPTETPPPPEVPVKRRRPILPYVCLGLFLLTFFSGPLCLLSFFAAGPFSQPQTVVIPRGSSVQEMAALLDQKSLLVHPFLFRLSARFMAKGHLRAGEYLFPVGSNVLDITKMMMEGKTVLRQVTVAEGLTSADVVNLLQNDAVLTGDVPPIPPEGSLWPETYNYTYGDTRASVLSRMQKEQEKGLQVLWAARAEGLPLKSPEEAVTLASIVEKETGVKAQERALVAGVFYNRLRRGMPLQSDPTVIYALTKGASSLGRSLTRDDLATASPFNTYQNTGLPPAPICNPGRAALEATLHPEATEFLYFVADGTGGHAFAKTLDEHNQNVARWIRLRR